MSVARGRAVARSGCNILAGYIMVCANGILPDITKDKPAGAMMQALQQSQGGTVSVTVLGGGSLSPPATSHWTRDGVGMSGLVLRACSFEGAWTRSHGIEAKVRAARAPAASPRIAVWRSGAG